MRIIHTGEKVYKGEWYTQCCEECLHKAYKEFINDIDESDFPIPLYVFSSQKEGIDYFQRPL